MRRAKPCGECAGAGDGTKPGWVLKSLQRATTPHPSPPRGLWQGKDPDPIRVFFLDRPIWLCEEEDRKQGGWFKRHLQGLDSK